MASTGLGFNQKRKQSGFPTKWMWFYTCLFLPLYFLIISMILSIQLQLYMDPAPWDQSQPSDLILILYHAVVLIVTVWAFFELLWLTRRAYRLAQVSAWSLLGFVPATLLVTLAEGRTIHFESALYLSAAIFIFWSFPIHYYFKRRKALFGPSIPVSETDAPVPEPDVLTVAAGEPSAKISESLKNPSAADGHPTNLPPLPQNLPGEPGTLFEAELAKLQRASLISEETFRQVLGAHRQFNAVVAEQAEAEIAAREAAMARRRAQAVQEKRSPTRQELRDRNITLVLILGVLFVMLAGTIFATSNWSLFSSALKTALILLVAVLFFGVSLLAEKKLHIAKTAFAFWVLGALFVPVIFLSIGYFELFGRWLSLNGEGKYVLGLLSMATSSLVYGYSTLKFNNRIFAWMTLTAVSLGAAFTIAALRLGPDRFYLGIALVNGLFVLAGLLQKMPEVLKPFHRELHRFVPVNLSISSALMLVFFEDPQFQGINLLLASGLYTAMTFTKWEKEYSFPASLLLMIGLYQFVEHSFLESLDLVLFSVTGFVFLGLSLASAQNEALKRLYRYTSAAAALAAFVYIQMVTLAALESRSTWTALAGLLLIALNDLVLASKTGERMNAWAFPLFLTAAAHQGFVLIQTFSPNYLYAGHMGSFGAVLFLLLYVFNPWKQTQCVKGSSGITAVAVMAFSYLNAMVYGYWRTGICVLAALIALLGLTYFRQQRQLSGNSNASAGITSQSHSAMFMHHLLAWSLPLLTMTELLTTYMLIDPKLALSASAGGYSLQLHSAQSVLILFLIAIGLRGFDRTLSTTFFWVTHGLLPAVILLLLPDYSDVPPVFAVSGLLYLYSFRMIQRKAVEPSAQSQTVLSCAFLYGAYVSGGLTVMSLFEVLKLSPTWNDFILPVFSLMLFAVWRFMKAPLKVWTLWFLIPSAWLGAVLLAARPASEIHHFAGVVVSLTMALYLMRRSGLEGLNFVALLPLFLSTASLSRGVFYGHHTTILAFLAALTTLLDVVGRWLHEQLYVATHNKPAQETTGRRSLRSFGILDGYTLNALLMILLSQTVLMDMTNPGWLRLLPPLELSALLFMQRSRAGTGLGRQIANTLWFVSLLLPYWVTLDLLQPPRQYFTELRLLPLLPMVTFLTPWQWKSHERILRWIEAAVLVLIAVMLFVEILSYDLLTDALILGVLSLGALFYGMQRHRRDYFFTGAAALLANTIFQTRGFWRSLPWWAYLLMAGLTLIGIASYNELKARR